MKRLLVVLLLLCCTLAVGQDHKFFDKANVTLFSLHAATTAWDALETHQGTSSHFLTGNGCIPRHDVLNNCPYIYGAPEGNPIARPFVRQGTAGVVTFFAGEVAANIAGAYLFHHTGHHKLERIVSTVNIAFSVNGGSSWHR